jgi:hypothetical protein
MQRGGEWVQIDEAMAEAETLDERLPYPVEWYEAAEKARALGSPNGKRPRFDQRSRPTDD